MCCLTLLTALSLHLCCADPPLAAPTAKVHFIALGQGDATLLVSPAGKTMLIDGGADGMGTGRIIPLLRQLQISRLDHLVATHWHPDHVGGLDEVIRGGWSPTLAWDRGDSGRPGYSAVNSYLACLGRNRRLMTPGQVIDLGGGMRVFCLAVNGQVDQGPTISFAGRNQEENGRSIALRISLGGFDLWVGGDLTGGGSGTADLETPAGLRCGDVDIYQANHHGSATSSNSLFLSYLKPEVTLFSAGKANPYGHPTSQVVQRINQPGAVRMVACTTGGAAGGNYLVTGSLVVETDGFRYRLTGAGGAWEQWLAVDDFPGTGATGLLESEFHRAPAMVTGTLGEYIELAHLGAAELDLQGLTLSTSTCPGGCTLAVHLLQRPGDRTVIGGGGDPQRNGGYLPALTWPPGTLGLADQSGWLALSLGEKVTYGTAFPGGSGRAAVRLDLGAGPTAAAFGRATTSYGQHNRGSPGLVNYGDQTVYGADLAVTSPALPGTRLRLSLYAPRRVANLHLVALSGGSMPGFNFGGKHIPLNLDGIFTTGLLVPELAGLVPSSGRVDLLFPLPWNPWLSGLKSWAAALVFDPYRGLDLVEVSPARAFRFP